MGCHKRAFFPLGVAHSLNSRNCFARACSIAAYCRAEQYANLFRLSCRSRFWGDVPNVHLDLPSVALTDINRRPFALELYRIAGLGLKSRTPIPTAPQSIATCTYNMRGILIGPDDTVAGMILCKYVCKVLLDGLATVNRIRLWRQENRVFRVQRGYGSGVILIKRILIRFIFGIKQLLLRRPNRLEARFTVPGLFFARPLNS